MPAPPQPIVCGGTYDWFLNPASINTEAAPNVFGIWNITGATVTITFVNPSGVGQSFTATIISGSAGTAHYINTTSLFNVAGTGWWLSWRVSLGGTVLETQPIYFEVFASGAAVA
jgi:hypothetical protein